MFSWWYAMSRRKFNRPTNWLLIIIFIHPRIFFVEKDARGLSIKHSHLSSLSEFEFRIQLIAPVVHIKLNLLKQLRHHLSRRHQLSIICEYKAFNFFFFGLYSVIIFDWLLVKSLMKLIINSTFLLKLFVLKYLNEKNSCLLSLID